MSTITVEGVWTRHQSMSQDPSQNVEPTLEEVLSQNRSRRAAQKNQGPSSKSTGNKGPSVVPGDSPGTVGRAVWNEMF